MADSDVNQSLPFAAMFATAVKSRLMLHFYASFMAFFISRTRTDVFSAFHDKNRDMAYERSGHANSLLECYSDAMAVLSSLQQITTHKYALIYLPVGPNSILLQIMLADCCLNLPGYSTCRRVRSSGVAT